jgi:predicted dienelactone hydrolase
VTYDPFKRGAHPVGVRSAVLRDGERGGRELAVEVWYPADASVAFRDVDPGTRDRYQVLPVLPTAWQAAVRDAPAAPAPAGGERRPLILFSHGLGGHRRQSTFVCTHLASHGYLVAGVDHAGNTLGDLIASFMGWTPRAAASLGDAVRLWMADRPRDASFVLDALLGGAVADLASLIDPGRIGVFGHSFGGWTTINAVAGDLRVRAGVALAPAGGGGLVNDPLPGALRLDWTREVPLLIVAAEKDSILPLAGIRDMYTRAPDPKRLVVLANADHMHFLDDPRQAHEMFRNLPVGAMLLPAAHGILPFDQLLPSRPAHDAIRALTLAHFDTFVRAAPAARAWLHGDLAAALSAVGAALA